MSNANLFEYFEGVFASYCDGNLKSGWGWTVKNEALEEVVRSLRTWTGERVSVEALTVLLARFPGEKHSLVCLLPPGRRAGLRQHGHQVRVRAVIGDNRGGKAQHFKNFEKAKSLLKLSKDFTFALVTQIRGIKNF